MNILAIFQKRTNKPFMTSLEVITETVEGEPEFQSQYSQNPNLFDVKVLSCSEEVYESIKELAGTMQAPAIIADAAAQKYDNRINVYIENGSLKIA